MKINPCISFKGTFYTVADSHTRLPMTAGLLSEIENRSKNETEPVFLLDGGDFMGDNYPLKTMSDMYLKFRQNNPNINFIFNLGNVELEGWFMYNHKSLSECGNILKNFNDKGIKIVNATIYKLAEENDSVKDYIKPYIMLDDIVDGEHKKVLVTGFTQRKMNQAEDEADTKELLRTIIKPAIDREKPDSVILMMHTMKNYTKDILDYAENNLKINNIELVTGAHPHSIEDFQHGNARVLYPAPNGKCAYEIKHTKNGFEFDKIVPEKNHYHYEPVAQSKSVISNIDINNPLPVNNAYSKILSSVKNMNNIIAKSMFTFKTRSEYNFIYSGPTELGTFMANSIKDRTNSDIGIMLTQDFREKLPEKGKDITYYNISDVVNVNKQVYQIQDVTVGDLKNIFEISLKNQNDGETNPDFFEYSSNIKIDRKTDDSENKISQIYINENGSWHKLLDENGRPADKNKKFTVATCEFIANGGRPALEYFKTLKSAPFGRLKTRDMVEESLRILENNPPEKYQASIMTNI
ncbi:5'-Nucleotidase domain protein [Clostridium sp. CAG:967]|nr:5'-Nucleotidase domain protein [Clostridium sp. CAG:967]